MFTIRKVRLLLLVITLSLVPFTAKSQNKVPLTHEAMWMMKRVAVHAGKIQLETGGPITIEMRPGESSYKGTARNGIKTNDYGQYGSSFVVK